MVSETHSVTASKDAGTIAYIQAGCVQSNPNITFEIKQSFVSRISHCQVSNHSWKGYTLQSSFFMSRRRRLKLVLADSLSLQVLE